MPTPADRPALGRREFLAASAAALLAGPRPAVAVADDEKTGDDPDDRVARAVVRVLDDAGIGPTRVGRSPHYQVIGDASDDFLKMTLESAELLHARYFPHFRALEFGPVEPKGRLAVIALAARPAFIDARRSFDGTVRVPSKLTRGSYHLVSNLAIFYDAHTDPPGQRPADPDLANLRALRHELAHQLTFNTGLLRRGSDPPVGVAEGLAMYCEALDSGGRDGIGRVLHDRLDDLRRLGCNGRCELSAEALIARDDWASGEAHGPELGLHAYAHCWLLVHYLISRPDRRPGFRRYLDAVARREPPTAATTPEARALGRLTDAREHLGDLGTLNGALALHGRAAASSTLPNSSRFGSSNRRRP